MTDATPQHSSHGMNVKQGRDLTRVELSCPHQHGVLYAAPAPRTWVCDAALMHAHALAGFLRDLTRMDDARVREAMQRWGIYYRELPLAEGATIEVQERRQGEADETG